MDEIKIDVFDPILSTSLPTKRLTENANKDPAEHISMTLYLTICKIFIVLGI